MRDLLDVFDDAFIIETKEVRTYSEAFEKAIEKFERDHGFTPFPSYDAFRKAKERRRKKHFMK